jgi:hypothetical protein
MAAEEVPRALESVGLWQANKKEYDNELAQYIVQIMGGVDRIFKLIEAAGQVSTLETAEDILRAAVVMPHAYLEDFLRTNR